MKILHLTLKREWFDMIASGEKKEEYREITPYWIRRLVEKDYLKYCGTPTIEELKMPYGASTLFDVIARDFNCANFYHGYSKNRDGIQLPLINISIGAGNPDWGAETGKEYFVIKLGDSLTHPL